MKVVLAGFQAVSILRGGPNTQIRRTADALGRLGVEVSLFDTWGAFDARSADLVHIFSAGIGTYHLAREIRQLGIPFVVSPITYSRHSARFVRTGLRATRLLQKLGPGLWSDYSLIADICDWAAAVLPNTQAEARLLGQGLGVPAGKITVVPNGVEERFAHGDPRLFREEYGIDRCILNVGHIGHPRKNVLTLVKALGAIDHPAVIIGRIVRGSYGDACLAEARKHTHILLIDSLDHSSDLLASAYACAKVFVLPSTFETPGIAALEAGLAGANVVITPYGGTKEYFDELAEYVEPDSEESIREGILRALAAPRDGRLKERIRDRYLWERVGANTLAVYESVLGGAKR